jgi:DNA-binding MarR family transcriptional regulator
MNRKERLIRAIDGFTRLLVDNQARFVAKVEEKGLTTKQLVYLDTIAKMPIPKPGAIAQELGLSKPSITAILDNFVRLGYLRKESALDDARSYSVQLTERGRELEKLHRRSHEDIAGVFMEKLDPGEVDQLIELLERTAEK